MNSDIEFHKGRWLRVIDSDNKLWCETSDEEEAQDMMRPGDKLERLYVAELHEWREVK